MIKAAKSKKYGVIYNVVGVKEISVNKISKLIGGKVIHIPKRPGEPDRSLGDIKKIKKDLKWLPKINIENGVKNLLKNIDYWKQAPVWTLRRLKRLQRFGFSLLKIHKIKK